MPSAVTSTAAVPVGVLPAPGFVTAKSPVVVFLVFDVATEISLALTLPVAVTAATPVELLGVFDFVTAVLSVLAPSEYGGVIATSPVALTLAVPGTAAAPVIASRELGFVTAKGAGSPLVALTAFTAWRL